MSTDQAGSPLREPSGPRRRTGTIAVATITGVVVLVVAFAVLPSVLSAPDGDRPPAPTATGLTAPAAPTTARPSAEPSREASAKPAAGDGTALTDLESVNGLGTWERGPVTMGGKEYANGISTGADWDVMIFNTGERYSALTLVVGLDDGSAPHPATVTFKDDQRTIATVRVKRGEPVRTTVSLAGVVTLRVTAEAGGGRTPTVALGDPVLTEE
jgi:hypothetical protein